MNLIELIMWFAWIVIRFGFLCIVTYTQILFGKKYFSADSVKYVDSLEKELDRFSSEVDKWHKQY